MHIYPNHLSWNAQTVCKIDFHNRRETWAVKVLLNAPQILVIEKSSYDSYWTDLCVIVITWSSEKPHFRAAACCLRMSSLIEMTPLKEVEMSPTSQYMEGVAARVRKELIARILCTQKKRIFVSSSHITFYSWTSALLLLLLCKGFNRTRMRRLNSKVTFASEVSLRTSVRMELEVISAFFLSFFFY